MNEVVQWLNSPEGEAWSRKRYRRWNFSQTVLVSIKDDEGRDWVPLWWRTLA